MAEFIGYESNRGNIVDWGKIASGLTASVKGVEEKREGRRAENERIFQETQATISTPVNTERKTLQDFVVNSAGTSRNKLKDLYDQMKRGEISRSQFKAASANINKSWGDLAGIVKTIDQRMAEAEKRQELGENGVPLGSMIEVTLNEKVARLADFNKLGIDIDSNGVMKAKYSGDGGEEFYEISSLLAPGNAKFDRADLSGLVGAAVKNWEERSKKNITDIRLAGAEWTEAKDRVKSQIVANPRTAASLLVDGSGEGKYKVFIGAEDRQRAIDEFKSDFPGLNPEDYLIEMRQDAGGVFQPMLNEKQIEAAKALVDNEIEMTHGSKQDYPQTTSYGGGGGGGRSGSGSGSNDDEMMRGYVASIMAFGYDPEAMKEGKAVQTKEYDFSGLSKQYQYRRTANGVEIYEAGQLDETTGKPILEKYKPLKIAKQPKELAQYIFNGEAAAAASDYEKARSMYLGGNTPTKGTSKPSVGAPRPTEK